MYPCEHCGQPRDGKSRNDNSGPHDCIAALKQSLAAAEAARDIAEKQLALICEGVNRRCGADNHQLPLVSLDRMLAAHKRDLTECRRLLREARDECRNRIDYRCVVCRGADAVERFSAAEAEREQYRMLAVSYGKTLRVSEASVDSIVTARLAQKRAAKGGRDATA